MNGTNIMVILRSRSEGRVRVDIIAGTEQPNPINIGTKLRPDRPMQRNSLSIKKATRAIYPVSSKMERKKNKITITGRKLKTLPTPAMIPSIISDLTIGFSP